MPATIPSLLVEFILLGPADDRRQLQDSPILGDVWARFARQPDKPLDLLITPCMTCAAGVVAAALQKRFETLADKEDDDPRVSYVQGIVAARLRFRTLLRVVVPMTQWFADKSIRDEKRKIAGHRLQEYGQPGRAFDVVQTAIAAAQQYFKQDTPGQASASFPPIDRYAILTSLILWAGSDKANPPIGANVPARQSVLNLLDLAKPTEIADELAQLVTTISNDPQLEKPLVWQISCNRTAKLALVKSIPAVKADAAANLFKVDCRDIGWAVLDSGIDAKHPAFSNTNDGRPRVRRCFDFTRYRNVISLSNSNDTIRGENLDKLLKHKENLVSFNKAKGNQKRNFFKKSGAYLKDLAEDARCGRAIDWELVQKFVEITPDTPPLTAHGTHVARHHRRQQEGRGPGQRKQRQSRRYVPKHYALRFPRGGKHSRGY